MALQDSDNFIVGRGDESYKITYQDLKDDLNYVPPPVGTINKPTVLGPADGAGSGVTRPIVTDAITAVEGGGTVTCETELIQSVDETFAWDRADNFSNMPNSGWSSFNNMFNGSLSGTDRAQSNGAGRNATSSGWALTGITKLEVYIGRRPKGPGINFIIDGVDYQSQVSSSLSDGSGKWKTISGPTSMDSFSTKNGSDQDEAYLIWAWRVNGQIILNGDRQGPSTGTSLTFPSAQGFDCFEPGDVVQSVGKTSPVYFVVGDPDVSPQGGMKFTIYDTALIDMSSTAKQSIGEDSNLPSGYVYKSLIFDLLSSSTDFKIGSSVTGWTSASSVDGVNWVTEKTVSPGVDGVSVRAFITNQPGARYLAVGAATTGKSWVTNYNFTVQFDQTFVDIWASGSYLPSALPTTKDAQIVSIDDSDPFTITVDGGEWTGSDGSGTPGEQTTLVKEIPYDTKLTLAGSKDLADLNVGDVVKMGMDADVPYQPVSDSIVTVTADSPSAGQTTLTLSGDTDLAYFREGDVVQRDTTSPWLQGTEWSKYLESSSGAYFSGRAPSTTFNGNNDPNGLSGNGCTTDSAGVTLTFEPPAPIPFSSSVAVTTGHDGCPAIFNDGEFQISTSTGTFTRNGSGEIRKITITSPSNLTTLFGIYVDDKLLVDESINDPNLTEAKVISIDESVPSITVDGGEWNGTDGSGIPGSLQGDWTNQLTGTGASPTAGNGKANVFNNDLGDKYELDNSGNPVQIRFDFTSPVTGTIEVSFARGCNYWRLSDGQNYGPIVTADVYSMTGTNITYFEFGNTSGKIGLRWIKINGSLLLDNSATPIEPGDTKVTCQSPLKAPTDWTVEAIDTTANTLSLSHAAEDSSQVWVANDNQAGTDFYVTGPSIVDEPLLTADVELESSNFATTPVDSDTLKNIVWELNGVEQNAGTMNPYKPTLNTGTTYTVRVKHEGNTLEDSPWSDQTTFTTGASRNLYEYQRAQIQSLTTRIGGLEANDVTDDATDTALLTLLSNLAIRVQALEESN